MSVNSVKQVGRILQARDKSIEHHLMERQVLGSETLAAVQDIRAYAQIFQERASHRDADISGFASQHSSAFFETHL